MGDWIHKKSSFKEICKSLVGKKSRNKSFNKNKTSDPMTVTSHEVNDHHKGVDENRFLSKTASKRSKTPTPTRNHLSRQPSRKCTTSTPFSRNASIRTNSSSDTEPSILKRIMSRRRASSTTASTSLSASPSIQMSRKCFSEPQAPKPSAFPLKDNGRSASLSRSTSGRSTTPIIFSQSIVRRKPLPVEMKLECSLEDLCFGLVKKIKITKDVLKHTGIIGQEEEMLKIEVKPGWRKGTKITFEGKGDEKPGYLPADIVFLIDEKDHPLFTRDGDNLEVRVEIPLVDALTGCSIQVPLIEGETMTLSFEDTVIYPGYQKVIEGKGMPNPKQDGKRGDLHIKFLINFPTELTDEQKEEAVSYLEDCS